MHCMVDIFNSNNYIKLCHRPIDEVQSLLDSLLQGYGSYNFDNDIFLYIR